MKNQYDVNIKEQYILSDGVINLKTFIKLLQKIEENHGHKGDIVIYITGCYGSIGHIEEVWFEQDKADYKGNGDSFVKLVSDICSG